MSRRFFYNIIFCLLSPNDDLIQIPGENPLLNFKSDINNGMESGPFPMDSLVLDNPRDSPVLDIPRDRPVLDNPRARP